MEAVWATVFIIWGGATVFGLALFGLEAAIKVLDRWFADW